ncbi:MAG: hypothetical protein JW818_13565 [Pirellulales bacterium]|nr:hypothetical protein [Pirellulales bacterium]
MNRLRCEIELPPALEDFFDFEGILPTTADERRRFARMDLRSFGALEYRQTFPVLPRSSCWHRIYTKDLSRGGLCFLHSEQLFPMEQMHVILPAETVKTVLPRCERMIIEIRRCQRRGPRCYEIGACFISSFRDLAAEIASAS